jgi:ketosteroid isomerase-like protein
MNMIIKSAAVLLLAISSFSVKAQVSEKDHQSIQQFFDAFLISFQNMDAAAVTKSFSKDAVHIDPFGNISRGSQELLKTYNNLFNFWKSMSKPEKDTTVYTDYKERYLSPGTVLISFYSIHTSTTAGKENIEREAMSIILSGKKDDWKIESLTLTPLMEYPKP